MRSKKHKQKKKKSIAKRIWHVFLLLLIILFICIIVYGCKIYSKIEDDLKESIDKANQIISTMSEDDFKSRSSTNIYDKDGNLIKELKTVDYVYKSYDEINKNVFNAVVAVEDNRFYEHDGIDLKGLLRAVYSSIVKHQRQGGSTITQQLAKNVYLTMDQTIWRKISEAIIAQELENRYTKHQILEFYVNNINYGNGCYSIESAANYYFSKTTNDLSLAEIALLVGIPNNPTKYNPTTNMENALKRKNSILKKMYNQNMISEEEYTTEINREITLNINQSELDNAVTDYAQSYAIHESVEFLMKYYGFQFKYDFNNKEERSTYWNSYNAEYKKYYSELLTGGYDIYTSIDPSIQENLQNIVNEQMSIYQDVNSETNIYTKQAAATVIDNNTGLVIGIVGGRTQDDVNNSYNRAFLSARQPGSTIKPIIVYTPAMELGYNADSVLNDEYIKDGPKNAYSGYVGNVSLRHAVAQSINTVAYKLTQEIGVEKSLQYLSNMNFKYLSSEDKQSSTIGLGGFTYGVTTVEMASAYSTLARNGKYIEATNIIKMYDRTTKTTIYENTYEKKQIYDDGAAYLMTDVLKTVMDSGTGTRFKLSNMSAQAGKTGTTNSGKDLWFCGYTPSYSMSVWMGDDIPSKQSELPTQGKIWNKMMTILNQDKKDEEFVKPTSVYEENGTLKYDKNQKENELLENQNIEKSRIEEEKQELKNFKYKDTISQNEAEKVLKNYISVFNHCTIQDSSEFSTYNKYIENADKVKEKVSNTAILKNYEKAKKKLQNKIQAVKDSYNESNKEDEETQKNNMWNNIITDFENRKPDIITPVEPIIPTEPTPTEPEPIDPDIQIEPPEPEEKVEPTVPDNNQNNNTNNTQNNTQNNNQNNNKTNSNTTENS